MSRFDSDWNSIAEVVDHRVRFREFQYKIEVWLGDEHPNSGKKLDFGPCTIPSINLRLTMSRSTKAN